MTTEQKMEINRLRAQGFGYKKIAMVTGLAESTIKSHFRRSANSLPIILDGSLSGSQEMSGISPMTGENYKPCDLRLSNTKPGDAKPCLECGTFVKQTAGRKEKKFCSESCRVHWWNKNKRKTPCKSRHTFACLSCGKEFSVYGTAPRKFSSFLIDFNYY